MALTTDSLSVWELGHRWAGNDPDHFFWFRLPIQTKDNFRLLMDAILSGEIICETLTLAKLPQDSKADPKFYIRTYIDEIYACIQGLQYDRKLLRWAVVDRMDFFEWCGRRGITPPEFWFPPGWKQQFEMPEEGTPAIWAEHVEPDSGLSAHIHYSLPSDQPTHHADNEKTLRINQTTKIACQHIARAIWKEDISRTITSIVNDELIQKYGGADHYQNETVRGWIKKVAPKEVSSRRGRPRKNRDEAPPK